MHCLTLTIDIFCNGKLLILRTVMRWFETSDIIIEVAFAKKKPSRVKCDENVFAIFLWLTPEKYYSSSKRAL